MGKLKLNHFNLIDNFHLLAIHSSSEMYKIAFEINKKLKVSLKRIEDISYKNNKAIHSIYKYESLKYDSKMFLFSNKSMSD
ncbi:MAG: IPExxxVDY family protein, partial [Bacteroidota bacterium]|nr:IPExxxVDY family protein [Bacteroidota bacterium]